LRKLRSTLSWCLIAGVALAIGCSDESDRPKPSASSGSAPSRAESPAPAPEPEEVVEDTRTQAELIEAGRSVYNANCIACHSMDPTQDGALGPAVAGASYDLIEARVLHASYPEGYTPKRDTRVMVALPHLKPRLDELAAYLGSL
jgi:mono/diheme cytochrome c family protein